MKASTLCDNLFPRTDIDIDILNSTDKDEEVLVELPDETYRNIAEVFFLTRPNRIIIRLENK